MSPGSSNKPVAVLAQTVIPDIAELRHMLCYNFSSQIAQIEDVVQFPNKLLPAEALIAARRHPLLLQVALECLESGRYFDESSWANAGITRMKHYAEAPPLTRDDSFQLGFKSWPRDICELVSRREEFLITYAGSLAALYDDVQYPYLMREGIREAELIMPPHSVVK